MYNIILRAGIYLSITHLAPGAGEYALSFRINLILNSFKSLTILYNNIRLDAGR